MDLRKRMGDSGIPFSSSTERIFTNDLHSGALSNLDHRVMSSVFSRSIIHKTLIIVITEITIYPPAEIRGITDELLAVGPVVLF